ncbi:hypothetical protein [Woodsholea maritima]|uniref:hypothetical protein n=1 Tax=Woodsholea maritima TaxID=240237 RepID=UPI00037D50DC|nr:hypothetical protein [Woodsholea maritima]
MRMITPKPSPNFIDEEFGDIFFTQINLQTFLQPLDLTALAPQFVRAHRLAEEDCSTDFDLMQDITASALSKP